MEIRTAEGLIEAYVFEEHIEGGRIGYIKETFSRAPGVQFVGQFVGSFGLFARVVAHDLAELQSRIENEYWEAGVHSKWSLNLTAYSTLAPKRGSPPICALVRARATDDPFEVRDALDDGFLLEGEGAAVINDQDFDLLVDVGGDTIEHALDRVVAVRAFPGIGRTSTAFADLSDAIRPSQS